MRVQYTETYYCPTAYTLVAVAPTRFLALVKIRHFFLKPFSRFTLIPLSTLSVPSISAFPLSPKFDFNGNYEYFRSFYINIPESAHSFITSKKIFNGAHCVRSKVSLRRFAPHYLLSLSTRAHE